MTLCEQNINLELTQQLENINVSKSNINKIIKKKSVFEMKRGTEIISHSNQNQSYIYIISGIARQYILDNDGNDYTKDFFHSKQLINVQIFNSTQINLECIKPGKYMMWSKEEFENCFNKEEFNEFLIENFKQYIEKKDLKEISLIHDSAKEKLIKFHKNYAWLFHEIPHRYIASYLCIKPETLSRLRGQILNYYI